MSNAPTLPRCADMTPTRDCARPVSMIGSKGYIYCARCGVERRQSGAERVRKMTAPELRKIAAGEPLARY